MAGSERVVGLIYSYRLYTVYLYISSLLPKNQRNLYEFKLRTLGLLAIGTIGLSISTVSIEFEPYEIYNWDETGFQKTGLNQHVVSTR